jgi:acetyltransferase-like isoleucine patch superfamily enzyme
MNKDTSQNSQELQNHEKSSKKGLLGFFENLLRQFKTLLHVLIVVPLYIIVSAVLGTSLAPGILLIRSVYRWSHDWPAWGSSLILGASLVFSFFLCGFGAMFVVPLVNRLFVGHLKQWRGPYYSLEAIRWYVHNGLLYILRYSFLEYVTPSPFSTWFYQAMGMKVGRGTVINSTHISDPSLITLGEKVTIGGSATLVAHYGQGGFLVMAPVVIHSGVTVGLKATVMGGVVIGKNAKILPNSVLLPKTQVPEGETWGGVPARKIEILRAVDKSIAS